MKTLFITTMLLLSLHSNLFAENNSSKEMDTNASSGKSEAERIQLEKQVEAQMKREEKYAKEQAFYQGSDYNLSEHEIDPKSLESISVPQPQYDFDMDDVYSDN